MNRRGFGWLPDLPRRAATGSDGPSSGRPDWRFADQLSAKSAAASVPESHSNQNLVLSILDQGSLGCCVPSAGFQAIRMAQVRLGVAKPRLGSRLMGYYLARAAHGLAAVDSGTYLRTFFWAMNRFGFCAEDDYAFGYDVSKFAVSPPIAAYRLAQDQRSPTRYWAIPEGAGRIDELKRAIANGYGVCFGTRVDEDFADGRIDPTVPLVPPRAGITYGHALLAEGYDGDTFTIVNSWGEEFGDGGRCLFAAEYLQEAHSMWAVEYAPRGPR